MFRSYLLVAFRNLIRNRISSLINLLGLAIGMAAFVLIIQYVRFELSYDDFHVKQETIFRIQQDRYNKGELTTQWAAGCSAVGQALYENFEEVENFTRFQKIHGVFSFGEIGSNHSQDSHRDMVERAKEYIAAGDIFQANLSQRIGSTFDGDAFEVYRILTKINPSPFAFFFGFPEFQLVSCSPIW